MYLRDLGTGVDSAAQSTHVRRMFALSRRTGRQSTGVAGSAAVASETLLGAARAVVAVPGSRSRRRRRGVFSEAVRRTLGVHRSSWSRTAGRDAELAGEKDDWRVRSGRHPCVAGPRRTSVAE